MLTHPGHRCSCYFVGPEQHPGQDQEEDHQAGDSASHDQTKPTAMLSTTKAAIATIQMITV